MWPFLPQEGSCGMEMSLGQQQAGPGSVCTVPAPWHNACGTAGPSRPARSKNLPKKGTGSHNPQERGGLKPGLCPGAGRVPQPLGSCLMLSQQGKAASPGLCHLLPCLCHLSLRAAQMLSGNFPLCQVLNTYQANAASLEVCTRDNMLP